MKKHLLLCCLIGIMSILGYFYFQRKIIFIDHPTIEINSPFYYKKYIKKVKNGSINDKTLLIIDEPEVHLHPQWIVEYARILVLIHKYIGCHIFISSHNPDMIQAICYISEKQDVLKSLDFYLADEDDNKKYTYRHLSKDIEPIFECFNVSLNKIEKYSI